MFRRLVVFAGVAVVCVWASPPVCKALTAPSLRDSQRETWDLAKGPPGREVAALAQTPDGRMWVAGRNGLAWLDGQRWNGIAKEPGFDPAKGIVALSADDTGTLWLAPASGEPLCLKGGHATSCVPVGHHIAYADQLHVTDLEAGPKGSMWFSIADMVYLAAQGQLSWPSSFPREMTGELRDIEVGDDGQLWLGAARGLFYRDSHGDVKPHAIPPGAEVAEVFALAGGRKGAIYAAGAGFLLRMSKEGDRVVRESDGLVRARFTGILEDRAGNVWVSSDRGLVRWQPNHPEPLQIFTQADGLPSDDLTALFEDRQGGLWIGTRGAGVARFTDRPPLLSTRTWWYGLGLLLVGAVGMVLRWRRSSRGRPATVS